jgi:choline dehydrogenase-like flavoprotein
MGEMPGGNGMPAQADYVIVGGGSAGAVLANRLSEDPGTKVVLLEAGGEASSFLVQLPVGFLRMLQREKYDWGYAQDPDPTINGRSWVWSAGRMLGGGSSLNAQVYIRGTRNDFDDWAEMGATGWGFQDVFPYFLRSEHWHGTPSRPTAPAVRFRSRPCATHTRSAPPSCRGAARSGCRFSRNTTMAPRLAHS